MIEFGGITYYIDIDYLGKMLLPTTTPALSDGVSVNEIKTVTDAEGNIVITETKQTISNTNNKELENIKYDVIKTMIEVLVDNDEELDDTLGADRALTTMPLGYRLAFNTLHNCGILKEQ